MVFSFHVYRKSAPNGKLSVYVGRRDFTDHLTHVDPIDGMVWMERDYVGDRKVVAQVVMTYRYGREEDEVMGLTFARELVVAAVQVYPSPQHSTTTLTKLQERLQKKLGSNALPFHLSLPRCAPASVTLQQGKDETGRPCGVNWELRVFVCTNADDQPHRRSCVRLLIRRLQYAATKQGRKPMASCSKEFLLSPGKLHLHVTLDRQIYYHEEKVVVGVKVVNQSNKQVRRVKASIVQLVDVALGPTGQLRNTLATIESQDGCPVVPNAGLSRSFTLTPSLRHHPHRRGVAMDGRLKAEDTNLASSTLFTNPEHRDQFGIVVSYVARVKLAMGTLGGELVTEVPFTLMNQAPDNTEVCGAESKPETGSEKSARMVIEECRRMSQSDLLSPQKSQDSLDTGLDDAEQGTAEQGTTGQRGAERGTTGERGAERGTVEYGATGQSGTGKEMQRERMTEQRGTEERPKEQRATEHRATEHKATEHRATEHRAEGSVRDDTKEEIKQ